MEYLYLLPIVFMIHEFEEIIMLPTWLDKNKAMLYMRFPFMKDKVDFCLDGIGRVYNYISLYGYVNLHE